MRILSFNIRGLGGKVKKKAVRELLSKEKIHMLCIQETKSDNLDFYMCKEIWGSDSCEFVVRHVINNAGGSVTIWEKGVFKLDSLV